MKKQPLRAVIPIAVFTVLFAAATAIFYRPLIGLAVFLTNDTTYKAKPKGLIENFSMAEGEPLPMEKHWSDATRPTAEGRPDFEVSKGYELRWQERQIGGIGFHYCVLAV